VIVLQLTLNNSTVSVGAPSPAHHRRNKSVSATCSFHSVG